MLKILNEIDHDKFEVTSNTDASGKKIAIVNLKNEQRKIFIDWSDSDNPIGYTETNPDCTTGNTKSENASFAVALKKHKKHHGQHRVPGSFNRKNQTVKTDGPIAVINDNVAYSFSTIDDTSNNQNAQKLSVTHASNPLTKVEGVSQLVAFKSATPSGNAIKDYALKLQN